MSEFPAVTRGRAQWIVDTIKANQETTIKLLGFVSKKHYEAARMLLLTMHKSDRDALLQDTGILTRVQIVSINLGPN